MVSEAFSSDARRVKCWPLRDARDAKRADESFWNLATIGRLATATGVLARTPARAATRGTNAEPRVVADIGLCVCLGGDDKTTGKEVRRAK